MTPLIPLDSITNVDISIQENHTGTVTICGITKTAAEWRDMASSFSEVTKQRDMLRDELIRRDAHHRVIQLCATHRHLPYTYTIKASAAFIDTIPVCPHCNPEALT